MYEARAFAALSGSCPNDPAGPTSSSFLLASQRGGRAIVGRSQYNFGGNAAEES